MPTRQANPRELRGHWTLTGALKAGTAFTASQVLKEVVAFAGAARGRIRIRATQAGTLSAKWMRPDGSTLYSANNPADVAVAANVENKMDIDPHFGEGLLELTFTAGITGGTLDYVDVSQV